MDDNLYRTLKLVALALVIAWVGWAAYDNFFTVENPHRLALETGRKQFKDGNYEAALKEFKGVLAMQAQHVEALDGVARSLMQLGRNDEAMRRFDEVLALRARYEDVPTAKRLFGAAYANRGILNDRLGNYEAAIGDYETAAALDTELNDGPAWLTRFLRNQPEQQATILQRARYLRAQLELPEDQRLLRVPEIDAQQRAYDQ